MNHPLNVNSFYNLTIFYTFMKSYFINTARQNYQLQSWMNDLAQLSESISVSWRWSLGNAIVSLLNIIMVRPNSPQEVQNMIDISREFMEWKYNHIPSEDDGFVLHNWIERMEICHASLLRTRRWRIGSAIVDFMNKLLFRKRNLVTDLMADIFQAYQFYRDTYRRDLFIQKDIGLVQSREFPNGQSWTPVPSYLAHYEEDMDFGSYRTDLKTIAYYLPQFHAIPENSAWWGEGFTEWTNTIKARPLFPGHYQPREPHKDIGYYDLSDINVLKRQATMARQHGIHGFCFYHYWFHGKRLLGLPVDLLLNNPDVDMNFCLCWANESWTRNWDGLDQHILIEQTYSPEDDIDFIKFLEPFFQDPRYIRVNGKPMLLVYQVSNLPAPLETVHRWRSWCRNNGIGELHLVAVYHREAFPHMRLKDIGFDAFTHFPPNSHPCKLVLSDATQFDEIIFGDYSSGVYATPIDGEDIRVYRGCMLGWDNTARRGRKARIFVRFSIEKYYQWLLDIVEYTRRTFPENERFLFINAWNEWAEGTYLEPDARYGYVYLNTTSKAIFDIPLRLPVKPAMYTPDYKDFKASIAECKTSWATASQFFDDHCEVLEFGPAAGLLTRYLCEERSAVVDIIERDQECAERASCYARSTCVCDIEYFTWKDAFAGRRYDLILLTDILEHLHDPWLVLHEAVKMLKPQGKAVISVPNIAHAQILANLYMNDFTYTDMGIMDRTHLRFFTEATLKEMIDQAGLTIEQIVPVLEPFPFSETRMDDLKIPPELHDLLAAKEHAHVKQFVACCRKANFFRPHAVNVGTTGNIGPRNHIRHGADSLATHATQVDNRQLYLDLLHKTLIGQIYKDAPCPAHLNEYSPILREHGLDWPSMAHSMIGAKRMANVRHLTETVIQEEIPGDLIETGVWRGGACIMMRGVLAAYGVTDRRVWLADSFSGLPAPDIQNYPRDQSSKFHEYPELIVSEEIVRENFRKYDLLDDLVRFIPGWFKDTLHKAPIESIALLRLDGDMYESTIQALQALYPKVSHLGFVIIDDYHCVPQCKEAVHDFFGTLRETPKIQEIDGVGVYWRKTMS